MIAASQVTWTPFPQLVTLVHGEEILSACQNRGLVIKQEFSDSTSCTYLPPKEGSPNN